MTDFTELGVHCAAEGCNQQDFLPFTCDCCERTFCLSHRSYSAHSCPVAGDKDFRAFVCPLCKKTVRFTDSQDPNEEWELHIRRDCNPTAKKPPKQRCPAPGCRQVLGPANKQRCARCGQETCLMHRFPDSHPCIESGSWKGRGSAAAAAAANRRRREEAARPMSLREKAALKASVALSKDNTVRTTADRRRRQGNAGHGGGARASAGGGGAQQGSERCPQCGAVFGNVGSLVNHVESYHSGARQQRAPQRSRASGNSGSNNGGGASRTCPICTERFPDVNHLLSHMESAHPEPGDRLSYLGQGAKNCSIS